jgi:hypothetical protein
MLSQSVFALALAAVALAAEQPRHTIELVQRPAREGTFLRRRLAARATDIPLLDYYLGTDLQ